MRIWAHTVAMEIALTKTPRLALLALLASTALATWPAHALSTSATPEGAQRLMESLQAYFGKPAAGEKSALTVTPSGSEYKLSLDTNNLFKPMAALGFAVETAPWELSVADNGDGTWHLLSTAYPSVDMKSPGGVEQHIRITDSRIDAVFNPQLGYVTSGTFAIGKMTADATGPGMVQTSSYGPLNYTMTGKAKGASAADVAMDGTLAAYALDMTITDKGAKAAAPTHVAVKAGAMKISAGIQEMHARALLDLWAFVVAHPGKEALAASQADFKALLRTAMPGFASVTEHVDIADLAVETAAGSFGGKDIGLGFDMSGAVSNSHYNIALKASSLKLPAKMLPAWYGSFLPSAFDMSTQITGMDFGAAAKEAIEDFSLNGDKPVSDADAAKITQALLPSGMVKITLAPSHIVSAALDIHADGVMEAGPAGASGKATISATGIDKALDELKSAMGSDKSAAQGFGALSLAKGLGKPGANGALVWVVEMTPDRKVLINGAPFGGK